MTSALKGRARPASRKPPSRAGAGRKDVLVSPADSTPRDAAPKPAAELNELKSTFVSLVSHEFRTPLGVIYSAVEILEAYFDRLKTEQRLEYLKDIKDAAKTMRHLLDEVLVLEKTAAGRMECRPGPVDFAALLSRLGTEVQTAQHRRASIEVEQDGMPSEIWADEALLRHIFTNLLSNAVKYSNEGGRVVVRMRRAGMMLQVEVADAGIGIPQEDQARLFEAFHRARNAESIQGTGLGLSIVRKCVELHRGIISFQSVENSGTTFTVSLPVLHQPASA